MSLRPSLQTACRALALRSRPLAQRQEPLIWAATKRGYSDELRKGERSQIPVLKKTENAAFPQGQEVPESAPGQQQVWRFCYQEEEDYMGERGEENKEMLTIHFCSQQTRHLKLLRR